MFYPISLFSVVIFAYVPVACSGGSFFLGWDGVQCPGSSPGDVLMLVAEGFLVQLDTMCVHFQAADCKHIILIGL